MAVAFGGRSREGAAPLPVDGGLVDIRGPTRASFSRPSSHSLAFLGVSNRRLAWQVSIVPWCWCGRSRLHGERVWKWVKGFRPASFLPPLPSLPRKWHLRISPSLGKAVRPWGRAWPLFLLSLWLWERKPWLSSVSSVRGQQAVVSGVSNKLLPWHKTVQLCPPVYRRLLLHVLPLSATSASMPWGVLALKDCLCRGYRGVLTLDSQGLIIN